MHGVRGLVLAGAGLAGMLVAQPVRAQGSCTFTDESGKTVTWPNCKPPADSSGSAASGAESGSAGTANGVPDAPAARSFPYPGDTPRQTPGAAGRAGAPGSSGTSGASGGGTSAGSSSAPAGSRFPYPGDKTAGNSGTSQAGSPGSGPLQDAGSSGSSSSSSEDGDSAAGPLGDDDPAARAAEARHARKKRGIEFHQTPNQREVEDLKVASFYQNDGDYRGAYFRAKDAVSIADDDAEAHLALANAARKMGKLDEAESNYKKCLTLDPIPKTKNEAEKALKEMSGGG